MIAIKETTYTIGCISRSSSSEKNVSLKPKSEIKAIAEARPKAIVDTLIS